MAIGHEGIAIVSRGRYHVRATTHCLGIVVCTLLCASIVGLALPTVLACTRVLWNTNKLAVVVGRTMDWPTTTDPITTVFRGA